MFQIIYYDHDLAYVLVPVFQCTVFVVYCVCCVLSMLRTVYVVYCLDFVLSMLCTILVVKSMSCTLYVVYCLDCVLSMMCPVPYCFLVD